MGAVARRVLVIVLGTLLSVIVALGVMRVLFDWSDGFGYSEASEWRYLGIGLATMAIIGAGIVASVLLARRVT